MTVDANYVFMAFCKSEVFALDIHLGMRFVIEGYTTLYIIVVFNFVYLSLYLS